MKRTVTKNFQSNLKSYSALAGTLLGAAGSSSAQVIYTDIVPDSTVNVNGGSYDLDLNNDGTFDFTFNLTIGGGGTSYSFNKVGVTPLNSNLIAGSTNGSYVYPTAMNMGDVVMPALTWNAGASQSMGSFWSSAFPYGNWLGVTDKFIGLQINVAGNIYYGWARLDVDAAASSFIIKDYAYMNAPNQPITIGSPVGIKETSLTGLNVYNDNRMIFVNNKKIAESIVTVTNIVGEEILNERQDAEQSTYQLTDVQAGIYFVTVKSNQSSYTKKIIIN